MALPSRYARSCIPIILMVAGVGSANPAMAMTAETRAYLISLGIDPNGKDVKLADADGEIRSTYLDEPVVFSLDRLASEKRARAIRQFIFTRSLIHEIKANYAAYRFPKTALPDYKAYFLTAPERQIVGRKVAESLLDQN